MAKKKNNKNITNARHPDYLRNILTWQKYRYTYMGGRTFIDKYLIKFSERENQTDFENRRKITYCPAHAKAALIDIKNSIYQRMSDIVRKGGPQEYQTAVRGEAGGVDKTNSTMSSFIGRLVLPEMLAMSRVGVFVDRTNLPTGASLAETRGNNPYMYVFHSEDILSWDYDNNNQLIAVLLREKLFNYNDMGLPINTSYGYRYMRKTVDGVQVHVYDADGEELTDQRILLNLRRIPFVIFEISSSLLTDVADYQIALLNMGSSDVNYSLKSNFPFYTEQYDPRSVMSNLIKGGPAYDSDGNEITAGSEDEISGKAESVKVGISQGRRYPKDLERPGFIHPSPLPLQASMAKQEELRHEIRILMNLTISNLAPRRASAESKQEDNRSLEAGLSYIGLELEHGEREIAQIWCDYLGERADDIIITYPNNYNLRTDEERRREAVELGEHLSKNPSNLFKKVISKEIVNILIRDRVSQEVLNKIHAEIDAAQVIVTDPEVVREDHEAGFVGTQLASTIRGYPEGEAEQAKIDHADRLARIAASQSSASDSNINAARGVDDADPDNNTGKVEKAASRQTDEEDTTKVKTRGEGK